MKTIKYNIIALIFLLGFTSCNDFLDREPLSDITAQAYFEKSDQLEAYTMDLYPSFLPSHPWGMGTFNADVDTDNQIKSGEASNDWIKGYKLVPNSGGWDFNKIRKVNYFLDRVLPKYENNAIQGNKADIKQSIGEVYFFRAYEYFNNLTKFGDFPIIKKPLADDRELLIQKSKRAPRNQVARFILEDLNTAIKYLKSGPIDNKNRISKEVAELFKSRVALYEGTWLKYHKGTAFVPGGPGWPGKQEDINYPNGYDGEIKFFLKEAMESAQKVADKIGLTPNSHGTQKKEPLSNPYYLMFADVNMAQYPEVLLWRQFDNSLGVNHTTQVYLRIGTHSGYTRSLVESFLTKKGLPIYAPNSGYKGDNHIAKVVQNRDERLQLFMKKSNDIYSTEGRVWKYPYINLTGSSNRLPTGYSVRKGMYNNGAPMQSSANRSENGCLIFRASEAYLNYIEAQYELDGSLNGKSRTYWSKLRNRAGLPDNIDETIAATDLNKERDWAKYSKGQLVDETLYNIRRERRCEFIAEGMRMADLKRWRALDQVKNYQVEGIKVWNSDMTRWFTKNGKSELRYYPEDTENPNVSNPNLSDYLRPYQIIKKNNKYYDGLSWTLAHYYEPIPAKELQLASDTGKAENSMLYQNPGWPSMAGQPAL